MSAIPASARAARIIERTRAELAEETVTRELAKDAERWAPWGDVARVRCLEDTQFHLTFLVAALTMGQTSLFTDYVAWLVPMLESRKVMRDDVIENFRVLAEVLRERLATDEADAVIALLDAGTERALAL
ncbi:hypothetical protein [Sandaracinus amylolyticus]|uniref:Uncharacterized protein n=1 Tax=Sandaracinus amylolyticus TaxID=927083 RepID=A0A0F6W4A7_9BACT|nr:hypothetical protein [Sandaracinus amylolyticus]AKF07131.1 hypothetical protein DB32_004280 [Sandaracinus amylolyticus]